MGRITQTITSTITSTIKAEAIMAVFNTEYEGRIFKLKYGKVGEHLEHDTLVEAVAHLAKLQNMCEVYESGRTTLSAIGIAGLIQQFKTVTDIIDAIPMELPNGEEKTTES